MTALCSCFHILAVWAKTLLLRPSCVNILPRITTTCPRSQCSLSYRPLVGQRHRWHGEKIGAFSTTQAIVSTDITALKTDHLNCSSNALARCIKPGTLNGSPRRQTRVDEKIRTASYVNGWKINHLMDYSDDQRVFTGPLWPAGSEYEARCIRFWPNSRHGL